MIKAITILLMMLFVVSSTYAGGRYVGDIWVPDGKCFDRLKIEEFANKQYQEKLQKIESILEDYQNKPYDRSQVDAAVRQARKDAREYYNKTLQSYAPAYCEE